MITQQRFSSMFSWCCLCMLGLTRIKILHSQANNPSPQLENLHARRASIDSLLSPKLPCSNSISPELWRTITDHFSSAHVELWASKPSPGATKCCLRLKYSKICWNSVTVRSRPLIEGHISFPWSPYYQRYLLLFLHWVFAGLLDAAEHVNGSAAPWAWHEGLVHCRLF